MAAFSTTALVICDCSVTMFCAEMQSTDEEINSPSALKKRESARLATPTREPATGHPHERTYVCVMLACMCYAGVYVVMLACVCCDYVCDLCVCVLCWLVCSYAGVYVLNKLLSTACTLFDVREAMGGNKLYRVHLFLMQGRQRGRQRKQVPF